MRACSSRAEHGEQKAYACEYAKKRVLPHARTHSYNEPTATGTRPHAALCTTTGATGSSASADAAAAADAAADAHALGSGGVAGVGAVPAAPAASAASAATRGQRGRARAPAIARAEGPGSGAGGGHGARSRPPSRHTVTRLTVCLIIVSPLRGIRFEEAEPG